MAELARKLEWVKSWELGDKLMPLKVSSSKGTKQLGVLYPDTNSKSSLSRSTPLQRALAHDIHGISLSELSIELVLRASVLSE